MKSHLMAQAITGIDDNLITDAENTKPAKKNFKPLYAICAVAACLVLVFTFVLQPSKNTTKIKLLINDTIISDTPVDIHFPSTVQARDISPSISLDLSLQISDDTTIKVSHGTMDICSSGNTDTLIFTGNQYTSDKPVNIRWYLDEPDIDSVYTLTISDDNVYTLSYNAVTSLWSICKQ